MKLRWLFFKFWQTLSKKSLPPELPKKQNPKEEQKVKEVSSIVRSELNLEKNAVFTVSTYKERSREIADPEGKVTITVGKMPDGTETGVLTTNHFKIYLVLMEFWERAGKSIQEPVHFTTYKVIKRLDLPDNGQTYERVRRWLRELRYIPISFVHSFYNPGTKQYVNLADTTILSYLDIYEKKNVGKTQKTRGYGEFQFDRHILQNLLHNYVHPLRLDVIKSFKKKRDLAILLYTYIDRNLAFKNSFQINLENLFNNLDLSQSYVRYPADRKRVIEPVSEELRNKPLSTGILTYCEVQGTKDGKDYKLVCRKRPDKATNRFNSVIETKLLGEGIKTPDEGEKAKIEAYKKKLNADQRTELREKAIQRLKQRGAKEEFINEFAISAQENEILEETITDY